MSDITTCPQCERKLRVPAEMIGQQVKCPTCGATFTARVGGQPSAPPTPSDQYSEQLPPSGQGWSDQPGPYRTPAGAYDRPDFATRKKSTPGALLAPAICLLIVGGLGMIADAYQAIQAIAGTPDLRPKPGLSPELQQFLLDMEKASHGPLAFGLGLVFFVVSALIVVAAIMMMKRKAYGLCVTGSILAMVNFVNCCCILGLPIGIWALVILLQPHIKEVFD